MEKREAEKGSYNSMYEFIQVTAYPELYMCGTYPNKHIKGFEK